MYRFWVARLAVVAAAGLLALGPSTAAWAATVDINPGNVPTTAAGFSTKDCDPNQGGGPFPGQDVWVFVLPGNHAQSGDFVSVTAAYGANGQKTITAASDPGNFDNGGPSTAKAWIVTPAGWTLTAATAEITGQARFFNLTHTCPASSTPTTPAPTPTTPEPTVTTPGPTPTESESPGPVPSTDMTTAPAGVQPSGAPDTGGGGGSGTTGGMALGVGALTFAGASALGLALVRRRRRGA